MNGDKLKLAIYFSALVFAAVIIHCTLLLIINFIHRTEIDTIALIFCYRFSFFLIYFNSYLLAISMCLLLVNESLLSGRFISIFACYVLYYIGIAILGLSISFLANKLSGFAISGPLSEIERWLWFYSGPGAFIHLAMEINYTTSCSPFEVYSIVIGFLVTLLISLLVWRIDRNKWYLQSLRHSLALILWAFWNLVFLAGPNF